MNCQSCGTALSDNAVFCATCGTFVDARVEASVNRIAQQIVANDPNARPNYDKVLAALPEAASAHYRQRTKTAVDGLRAETMADGMSVPPETTPTPPKPKSDAPLAQRGSTKTAAPPPPITISEVTLSTPAVTMKKSLLSPPDQPGIEVQPVKYDEAVNVNRDSSRQIVPRNGLLLRFNDVPERISMATKQLTPLLVAREQKSARFNQLAGWLTGAGIVSGVLAFIIGFFLENFSVMIVLLAAAAALAAIGLIYFRPLGRQAKLTGKGFAGKIRLVEDLFPAIGRDLPPKRLVRGWLDLSDSINEANIHSTKRSAGSGRPNTRYRHDWLHLNAPLMDGTKARLWVTEECKQRMGFWKRGSISGKYKLKQGSASYSHRLRVVMDFNPANYQVDATRNIADNIQKMIPGSSLTILDAAATGNRVELLAVSNPMPQFKDVEAALRYTYGCIKRI